MALTKDEIVAAIATRKTETRTVSVPEWGGDVLIRRLTSGDLTVSGITSGRGDDESMLKALALSIVDEGGEPVFGIEQMRALDDADAVVTLKLFAEVAKFNGLSTPELEEMVAGFGEAQLDSSSSD